MKDHIDNIKNNENKTSNNPSLKLQTNNNITKRSYFTSAINNEDNKNTLILSYLDSIKVNVDKMSSDSEKLQHLIENEWIDIMKNKLQDPNNANHRLISCIHSVNETLYLYLEKSRTIKRLFPSLIDDLNKIANLIIAFSMIVTYSSKYGYTHIAGQIGRMVLYSIYRYQLNEAKNIYFKDKEKDTNIDIYEYFMNYQDFKECNNINEQKLVELGDIYINMFIFNDIVIRHYDKYDSNLAMIKINPDYIKDIVDNIIVHPSSLPMVCQPNKWSDNDFGGFLINREDQNEIIKGSSYKHLHKIENRTNLYKAVNYLNSIKFEINNDLLKYIENEGKHLIEELENNNKLHTLITLKLANIYGKIPFYLNVHADWRGRLYTHSFFLSYQGDDLSSSLIQFDEGESLNECGKIIFIFMVQMLIILII